MVDRPLKPPHFLRALASRNYRLYLSGQCVSLLGNWMTATASLWLVYHLSGSPFAVGLVGFATLLPVLVFSPFAGVWMDRVDPLKVMKYTQLAAMLQSGAMAAITLSGHMTVPLLVGMALLQGMFLALDFPARQTLIYPLAGDRSLLENVIALNSITFNLARLVGPALAGFVIAGFGPGFCFSLDAVAYLAVLWALMGIKLPPRAIRANLAHPLDDLREGLRYVRHHRPIRRALILVAVIALVGFAHNTLGPVFARDLFNGDARTLGFLMSATGAGSVIAAGFLSVRRGSAGLGRLMTWGAIINGLGLATIGLSGHLFLGIIGFGLAGFGIIYVMVVSNTLLQTSVADDKRGRVMSLFTTAQSAMPIGSLMVGSLAQGLGPRWAMYLCGSVGVVAGVTFALTRKERRA